MNFLKKLFQKPSLSTTSTISAPIENGGLKHLKEEDGVEKILPVLKNRSELDLQKKRGMFIDELFPSSAQNSPIIMYGEDIGVCIKYSPSSGSEIDLKTKNIALKNIKDINVPFEIQNQNGIKFSIIQHEYAAEKILDQDFLRKLSNQLNAEQLTIGIPMKGIMVVAPKEAAQALIKMTESIYHSNQNEPISKSLFLISSGEIVAMTA
jgi:uncharacterized protein YtpQ (UPF0354 family)